MLGARHVLYLGPCPGVPAATASGMRLAETQVGSLAFVRPGAAVRQRHQGTVTAGHRSVAQVEGSQGTESMMPVCSRKTVNKRVSILRLDPASVVDLEVTRAPSALHTPAHEQVSMTPGTNTENRRMR